MLSVSVSRDSSHFEILERRSRGGSWGTSSGLSINRRGPCDALERGSGSIWYSGSGAGLAPGSVATYASGSYCSHPLMWSLAGPSVMGPAPPFGAGELPDTRAPAW